ncbi:choloylglycine hydrolase family protein [Enterococcus sp. LJL98]
MCTSIFTKTLNGEYILSRTMDFTFPLEAAPLFIPKDYQWVSEATKESFQSEYGFIGAGRLLGTTYFVADGVNEAGLSAAELYLPGEVQYNDVSDDSKTNVAPHELILWILGNCKSVAEVEEKIGSFNLMGLAAPLLNTVTPLHWIVTDQTGRCVVIEPTELDLRVKENPVGVMTNSPNIEWHISNLRNYLNVQPKQFKPRTFGSFVAEPFSQGTGTSGLPGGYTPPERFVRAAFFKEQITPAKNESQGINNAHHILNTVRIPKGIVVTDNDLSDFSLYVGSMCNQTKTYYYTSYDNHQITKLVLDDALLSQKEPVIFNHDFDQETFVTLNK